MWHTRLMISGSLCCHRRHRIRIFRRKLSASFYLGVWIPPVNFSPRFTTRARTGRKFGANVSALSQFLFVSLYARMHARRRNIWMRIRDQRSVCGMCILLYLHSHYSTLCPYVLRMSGHLSWTNTLIRERRPHYTPHATRPCYDYITLL